MTAPSVKRTVIAVFLIAITVFAFLVISDHRGGSSPSGNDRIGGPYAALLNDSTDLGRARGEHAQLTVTLHQADRPGELIAWAQGHGLSIRWRPEDRWAIIDGTPVAVGEAFDVDVHDYRGRRGQVFYASPQQPTVPSALRGEVAGLERRREALNGEVASVQARLDAQRRDLADITARLARERSEGGQAIPTSAPEGSGPGNR